MRGGVEVGEPVHLGRPEEADLDAAALQPVVEDLRHRHDRVGRVGQLAVTDRERQPGGLGADACPTRRRGRARRCAWLGPGWPPCSAGRCRRSRPGVRAAPVKRPRSSCRRAVPGRLLRRRCRRRGWWSTSHRREHVLLDPSDEGVAIAADGVPLHVGRVVSNRVPGRVGGIRCRRAPSPRSRRPMTAGRRHPDAARDRRRSPRRSPARAWPRRTASLFTPVMPHMSTLPSRSACWAWRIVTSGCSADTAASCSPVNGQVTALTDSERPMRPVPKYPRSTANGSPEAPATKRLASPAWVCSSSSRWWGQPFSIASRNR